MIACPSCGTENADRAKFCNECGTVLAAPPPIAEERKVVTTLFCDLVAFTAMSETADPEDVDALLGEYFARATRVIESHGGTVEKFIGDAVVGVFGVPAVHEDDPERAVRAGLRLLESLEGMTRPDGCPLEARIGVNTGEALVRLDVDPSSGRGFLTGDAVNIAARLEAAAPPGGVVLGETTFCLAGRAFDCEEVAPVAAKGKSAPVAAWLATAPRARVGTVADRDHLTPLVDREVELAFLRARFDKAAAADSPQFALIVGEPGIGKSRLVAELFAYADARPDMITWRQGRCLPYGEGVTFWALTEVVKSHAGILETDDVATVEAKLEAVLPEGEDRAWFRQRLRALLGLDAAKAEREENFTAWLRFLEEIAARGPTVLVLEDLHWADDALLAFLEYFASHVAEVPLLLLATARPELFERHPTFAAGSTHLNHISLEPLTREETERLVSGLVGDAEALSEGIADIVEHCEGNPFFAEESARLLTDQVQRAPVPASVQALIAARLDALKPDHKTALGDAAVVGGVFWNGAVASAGQREREEVDVALHELVAKQLVRRVRESSMLDEDEYAFGHSLFREVAYDGLPRSARARKHAAVASWMESKAGDRVDELAQVLAHHYATALDLARAAGDVELAESLPDRAIRYLSLAGDRALNLDVVAAEGFYARALELAGAADPKRAVLLVGWARALEQRGRYREAAGALKDAIADLRSAGEIRTTATAMMELARLKLVLGESGAFDLGAEATALLDDDGPSAAKVAVLTATWHWLVEPDRVDLADAVEAVGRAIDMSGQLGLPVPARALGMRGWARLDLGDPGGRDDYQRAFTAAEAQGLGEELGQLYNNFSREVATTQGPRAASEVAAEGLAFVRRRGIRSWAVTLSEALIEYLHSLGEWDEALARAAELVPLLEETEDVWTLVEVRSDQALQLARRGEAREARSFLAWLVQKGRESEVVESTGYSLLTASAAYIALGDAPSALDLLGECATIPRPRVEPEWIDLVPEAVRTAVGAGDAELAARLWEGIEPRHPCRAARPNQRRRPAGRGSGQAGRRSGRLRRRRGPLAQLRRALRGGAGAARAGALLGGLGPSTGGLARP